MVILESVQRGQRLGNRLRRLRNKRGLSQKEVATQIGVAPSTYRDWEYGKRIVGEPYMDLAAALGVPVTELLTGKTGSVGELINYLDELDKIVSIIRKAVVSL